MLVVLLAIALAALVRLRLVDVPLERDEGEYAYAGQLILKGVPPYLEAYNMKFPGTYYAYALIMALFGQTARGIHVGLMLVNAGAALIVFAIARRLADDPRQHRPLAVPHKKETPDAAASGAEARPAAKMARGQREVRTLAQAATLLLRPGHGRGR